MAFPVVEEITATSFSASGTSKACNLPATVNAGDLLLVIFAWPTSSLSGVPSGWTYIAAYTGLVSNYYYVYAKSADGTEDGGTATFTLTSANYAAAQVYRIRAGSWKASGTLTNDIKHAGAVDSSPDTASPDSPNLSPGWTEDTLWISFGALPVCTISSAPTSYTALTQTDDASAASVSLVSARRELNAASENPGAFTATTSVTDNSGTLAIRPAAAAALLPRMSLMGVG